MQVTPCGNAWFYFCPAIEINHSSNKYCMKKNMGIADRIIRILVAAVFILMFALKTVTGAWGIVLLVAGCVFLLTSFISFCPLYAIFGFKTRAANRS
jgi:hypothetical protein